jgi:hypothetical protein
MGIDQPRENRRAIDVNEPRLWPRDGPYLVEVTERRHLTVANGERARSGMCPIARYDVPAVQDDRLHATIISANHGMSGATAREMRSMVK